MTMVPFLPPGLVLVIGGLLLPLMPRGWARDAWLVALPVLVLGMIVLMPTAFYWHWEVFDWRLTLVRADGLSHAFGYVFGIAALLAAFYLRGTTDAGQKAAALVYAGAALGAVYAGDLITLFVFWELTAIASAFLIWARRSEVAYAAGLRYLVIQVTSGLLLLGGILALQAHGESLGFGWIGTGDLAGNLVFAAFAIKGAFPLLHGWLTDAYPAATESGAAIMSMFTTKLAMYALIRGFAGTELLVAVGVVGAVYALVRLAIEPDARRAVCWALIIQLGIITTAIGVGTSAALAGAAMHAFAGIFYIGVMLMALGVVMARIGETRIDRLGGLYAAMPATAVLFTIGAAALSAVPLFAGFASKTLLFGALDGWPYYTLQAVSVGTFLFAGLRLPWLVFFGPRRTAPVMDANLPQMVAMTVAAAICVGFAIMPDRFLQLLPWRVGLDVWDAGAIGSQVLLLGAASAVFVLAVLFKRLPRPPRSEAVDFDWLYRRGLPGLVDRARTASAPVWDAFAHRAAARGRMLFNAVLRHHGPKGTLARTWPTGSMALWIAVMLGISLVIYYL